MRFQYSTKVICKVKIRLDKVKMEADAGIFWSEPFEDHLAEKVFAFPEDEELDGLKEQMSIARIGEKFNWKDYIIRRIE